MIRSLVVRNLLFGLKIVALAAGVSLASACSAAPSDGASCVPGKQESCPCEAGGSGIQLCNAGGTGFSTCACAADGPDTDTSALDTSVAADVDEDAAGEPDVGGADSTSEDATADGTDTVIPTPSCEPCANGPVKGVVCAPNEQHFVSGATVSIDAIGCDGQPVHLVTKSKADGGFYFPEVPCGDHTVSVQSGSFATSYLIRVEPVTGTDVSGAATKQCFKAQSVSIAVFWGQWDEQQGILESLGFEYTFYNFKEDYFGDVPSDEIEAVQVLRSPELLAQYQILFFNCASAPLSWVHDFPEIKKNLAEFVLNGGSFYASDLAWAYVEAAFPDAIDFYGSDDLPTAPGALDGPQHADGHQDVPATIVDPDLAAYVGETVFTAKYGPGPLILVDAPGLDGVEHVRGVVATDEDPPLFQPPIKVAGPLVLTFKPSSTSGTVVYTTFHNDEQADALMLKILDYLVFKL